MAKRKQYDWEAIKREYRAGQLSNREISRKYDAPESTIRNRAKVEKWSKDLTSQVKQKVKETLLRKELRKDDATDDEIVNFAAERGAKVIELQRADINNLRMMEQNLLAELNADPKKLYITQHQGKIIKEEVGIAVTDRAAALNNLANVQHKRIQLERQAYNLDDVATGETIEDLLEKLDERTA